MSESVGEAGANEKTPRAAVALPQQASVRWAKEAACLLSAALPIASARAA
jgi:hypothetical protein